MYEIIGMDNSTHHIFILRQNDKMTLPNKTPDNMTNQTKKNNLH